MSQSLFGDKPLLAGTVECLGQKFPSEEIRRMHYLEILREKLKDPLFRKIKGFPIGTDEDILLLSDPPYYTACPNPFIENFVKYYSKLYDPSTPYNKEPFATDVSEGKNDPIYQAHSYHTKVPHKAIMRYMLHYTQPGDVVLDSFCGTGMTGVAAQMCANKKAIEEIGYRVGDDGTIFDRESLASEWKPFSKLGARLAILNDLSPIATFIAGNYNSPVNPIIFQENGRSVMAEIEKKCAWMFETLHSATGTKGRINFTVWSDVYGCPNCAGEVVYFNCAIDSVTGKVNEIFSCPHCSTQMTKRQADRVWRSYFDHYLGESVRQVKQVPVLISYTVGKKRFEKIPDDLDLELLRKIESTKYDGWLPIERMIAGGESRRNDPIGITHTHQFYSPRNLITLATAFAIAPNAVAKLALTGPAMSVTKMYRWTPNYEGGGPMSGTLYVPAILRDISAIDAVDRFYKKLTNIHSELWGKRTSAFALSTCSSTDLRMMVPDNTVDYIFLDPPFGSNINYSELSFLWESWLKVSTNNVEEAIENKSTGKSLGDYRVLMASCFTEAYRVLKPGRWMTVEFSNTQAAVWNSIQTALQEAGFVVANVSALDKKQGTFKAITTTTAVKQDLVISAYKPDGGLEARFTKAKGSEDSVWDFVRTHLKYLPIVKIKNSQIEYVAERDQRIIFDRLVAWFVRHNFPIPISSQEFQVGLSRRFAERDGMVFLPEQAAQYDKKRMQTAKAPQMEMFIADERSAIDWLSDFLKKKPSTYQELHPEFMRQLGAGWKKHEAKPELSHLLESNFLCYDPKDNDGFEIPSQIHSYLSTNWQDLRNLEKSDPRLKAKATDRWYVPDPSKALDLEKIRDKALLKEFETYRSFSGRRMKTFRLEAMRTGFRHAWGNRDYETIIAVANKIPEEALQEDEKLLLWYDQALTRSESQQ
jgi:DNA modification methylase